MVHRSQKHAKQKHGRAAALAVKRFEHGRPAAAPAVARPVGHRRLVRRGVSLHAPAAARRRGEKPLAVAAAAGGAAVVRAGLVRRDAGADGGAARRRAVVALRAAPRRPRGARGGARDRAGARSRAGAEAGAGLVALRLCSTPTPPAHFNTLSHLWSFGFALPRPALSQQRRGPPPRRAKRDRPPAARRRGARSRSHNTPPWRTRRTWRTSRWRRWRPRRWTSA